MTFRRDDVTIRDRRPCRGQPNGCVLITNTSFAVDPFRLLSWSSTCRRRDTGRVAVDPGRRPLLRCVLVNRCRRGALCHAACLDAWPSWL